jgi:hypothetical protein
MPNGAHIQSTQNRLLDTLDLPVAARQVYIFPALSSGSFLSVGFLSYRGGEAAFSWPLQRRGPTILTGHRRRDRLWMIQRPTPTTVVSARSHCLLLDSGSVADRAAQLSPNPTTNTLLLDPKSVVDP